jgi:NADPH-dependent 2,4-dienoyl-CoA reductase/sulfur reductase-like enzyme/rhodanese-related sulfurtransferase
MSKPQRIVIIGGVAGGASAAARARRLSEDAEIILLERGPYVSFANCGLPYFIGGEITDRRRLLVQTPERLGARFDLDVRVHTEATAIDPSTREVRIRNLRTGKESVLPYDALVLSPGAAPQRPPIPGLPHPKVFSLRTIPDMDAILAAMEGDALRHAVVVGGGYIGLEVMEALRHRGFGVTLVEKLPQVMGVADPEMVAPLHEELRQQGVDLRLGNSVAAFREDRGTLVAELADGAAVACGFAILAVGVKPETQLAREAGLELGSSGGIRVDDQMRTSDPAIWAVGDAVEVTEFVSGMPAHIPLAGPANRQGRIAADAIFGRPSYYKGTQGTAICRVFNRAFAMTGLTAKAAARLGRSFEAIYVHPTDHATYYPGAQTMSLKVLFDPRNGRLLGAQAVGGAGVDKRIDVLAVALRAGLTVFDLEDLELCYAPPFGSAKDPVNMAGFVASNRLRGDVAHWEPEEAPGDALLLDVRTPEEFAHGSLPGAMLAPLDELRDRLEDLPRDRELRVFCQVGLRGYVACRLLAQHGFRCRNLSGGLTRVRMVQGVGGTTPPTACGAPPTLPR